MNTNQIRCFLEAALEKNFTRAAQKMHMSQPSISRIISTLEKELNVPLFYRSRNKKIDLTPSGEVYYEFFKKIQFEFELKREAADKLAAQKEMNLHFGYVAKWNIYPQLMNVFQEVNSVRPGIDFLPECQTFSELNRLLANRELDMILTLKKSFTCAAGIGSEDILELKRIILFSDKFTDNPGSFTTPEDFKSSAFYYATDSHPDINLEIQNFCRPYGFAPELKPLSNMETVITMVENGSGVCIIDYWGCSNIKGLHYIVLDSFNTVTLAWNNAVSEEVVRLVRESILLNLKGT
ncbi:LysR family transcriptional regulator [Parasporobacterium paucivorans]|uniref:DNA-binding transcriptional regulator, LysR family n=1 Tax=Parasporobacterium paucivorans DSM 15970 TaxID=1122934 RepID=A0A1M6JHS8_9FIRM|nr:LysR family transcriptional regulator [Parasporobacterium paucivorans]SHJ46226.1 DNA-binding transcriptional regulator, LysR family [Parasporobacterium paucivorans DSM 15970]